MRCFCRETHTGVESLHGLKLSKGPLLRPNCVSVFSNCSQDDGVFHPDSSHDSRRLGPISALGPYSVPVVVLLVLVLLVLVLLVFVLLVAVFVRFLIAVFIIRADDVGHGVKLVSKLLVFVP